MGTDEAISPAIWISAVATGPQAKLLFANVVQLPIGLPSESVDCGSVSVTAEASRRRPVEPVSTRTFEMLWQVVVPGTQIVTVVKSWFTSEPAGPVLIRTGCTLLTVGVVVPVPPEVPEELLSVELVTPQPVLASSHMPAANGITAWRKRAAIIAPRP